MHLSPLCRCTPVVVKGVILDGTPDCHYFWTYRLLRCPNPCDCSNEAINWAAWNKAGTSGVVTKATASGKSAHNLLIIQPPPTKKKYIVVGKSHPSVLKAPFSDRLILACSLQLRAELEIEFSKSMPRQTEIPPSSSTCGNPPRWFTNVKCSSRWCERSGCVDQSVPLRSPTARHFFVLRQPKWGHFCLLLGSTLHWVF